MADQDRRLSARLRAFKLIAGAEFFSCDDIECLEQAAKLAELHEAWKQWYEAPVSYADVRSLEHHDAEVALLAFDGGQE